MNMQAKIISGEIHLSITTIKNLLSNDLFCNKETKKTSEYIMNLIERLDNVKINYG